MTLFLLDVLNNEWAHCTCPYIAVREHAMRLLRWCWIKYEETVVSPKTSGLSGCFISF